MQNATCQKSKSLFKNHRKTYGLGASEGQVNLLRAEKCSSNHLKHNDSRGAFLNFCKLLRAGKLQSGLQNAKRENRHQKTIGFHDRNGGPNGHFAPKTLLKPL